MKTIAWQDRFKVGVPEIDIQHQGLLNIVNQLITSIENKTEWKTTSAIIDSLINYAYTHFATEERYMLQGKYPGLLKHVEIHVDFIRKVFNMSQKIEQKDIVLQREILTFLASWYTTHVLGIDREYIPYVTNIGKTKISNTQ